MNSEQPDLIVKDSIIISLAGMNALAYETAKDELRQRVEAQLPEGYGQDHGDYAQWSWFGNRIDDTFTLTYEVHL